MKIPSAKCEKWSISYRIAHQQFLCHTFVLLANVRLLSQGYVRYFIANGLMDCGISFCSFHSTFWGQLLLQGARPTSTHPALERELEILAAPNVETTVVRAEALEECSIYREEATGHGWRPHGLCRILVPLFLPFRNRVPVELIQRNPVSDL